MKNLKVMDEIQNEKRKEIAEGGNPAISDETREVMSRKKISIDQPYTEVKFDPLR